MGTMRAGAEPARPDLPGLDEVDYLTSTTAMEQTELPKIFDAFYQVDGSSTREYGGAGLGLSIAQTLIHQHGGWIDCESWPGQTAFTLYLPLNNSGEEQCSK